MHLTLTSSDLCQGDKAIVPRKVRWQQHWCYLHVPEYPCGQECLLGFHKPSWCREAAQKPSHTSLQCTYQWCRKSNKWIKEWNLHRQFSPRKWKRCINDRSLSRQVNTWLPNVQAQWTCHQQDDISIQDLQDGIKAIAGDPRKFPSILAQVGGSVDFMIGIQYLRYHPRFVFQLPSGLTIFESYFKSADGSRGIIGVPHKVFRQINVQHKNISNFVNHQFRLYSQGYHVKPDAQLLGYPSHQADIYFSSNQEDQEDQDFVNKVNLFEAAVHIGSEINFRCIDCRGCQTCKNLQSCDETISVQEEIEQDVIYRSVKVDIDERTSTATLPLMLNPETHLAPKSSHCPKGVQSATESTHKPSWG